MHTDCLYTTSEHTSSNVIKIIVTYDCIIDVSRSCSVMSNSLRLPGLYSPWDSPGQDTGMGSCSLLQGIFPTQGSNPGLPHCRRILYQLSHQGSPLLYYKYNYIDYLYSIIIALSYTLSSN